MSDIAFTLPCIPTAQARPRFCRSGIVAYKSGRHKADERTLEALLAPYAPDTPADGTLELSFTAVMQCQNQPAKR